MRESPPKMNMKEDNEHEQLAFTMSDADDKTWRHECQCLLSNHDQFILRYPEATALSM